MHDLCVCPNIDCSCVSESVVRSKCQCREISAFWLLLTNSSTNYVFDILIRQCRNTLRVDTLPMCWNEPEVSKFARPLPDSLCPILFGVWNPKIAILKSFKWCLRIKILFGKSSYQRWNTLCAFHKFRSMLKPQTGCQKVPRPGQLAILPGVRYLI